MHTEFNIEFVGGFLDGRRIIYPNLPDNIQVDEYTQNEVYNCVYPYVAIVSEKRLYVKMDNKDGYWQYVYFMPGLIQWNGKPKQEGNKIW